jgi:hypothetical protein
MKSHIAEISSIARHSGEIGLPVAKEQLCTKKISILPSEYHGFKTAWHNSNQEQQTLLSLTPKLLQEERELVKIETEDNPSRDSATSTAIQFIYQKRQTSRGPAYPFYYSNLQFSKF